jgi:hypothetical protein
MRFARLGTSCEEHSDYRILALSSLSSAPADEDVAMRHGRGRLPRFDERNRGSLGHGEKPLAILWFSTAAELASERPRVLGRGAGKQQMSGPWASAIALVMATTGGELRRVDNVDVPQCVTLRTEARKTDHGFDHVVYLYNRCPVAVECLVATNVDPEPPLSVSVPAGYESGIVVRTRARRRAFRPRVYCEPRARAQAPSGGPDASTLARLQ